MDKLYLIKSAIVGFAVGDALGVPVEFSSREEMDGAPVETMEGFGTYPYPAGTWSDDTSMTLASLDSLKRGIDFEDIDIGTEVKAPNLLTEAEYNKLKQQGDKRVIFTKSYDDYVKRSIFNGMAGI